MRTRSQYRVALATMGIGVTMALVAASSTDLFDSRAGELEVADNPAARADEAPDPDSTEPPAPEPAPPVDPIISERPPEESEPAARPEHCVGPLVPAPSATELSDPEPADELHARVLSELDDYLRWLDDGDARGIITEVGWPDGEWIAEWNAVAETWYRALRDADIWVTVWAAGEWWENSHDLSVYRSTGGEALDTTTGISPVVERHRGISRRGVNLNGAEFGIGANIGTGTGGRFSNRSPGRYGVDWKYPSAATFDFLACRGIDLVRLPFRWERVQPEPGGALDPTELARLAETIEHAARAGIDVIPAPMNYGAYWLHDSNRDVGQRHAIGSPWLTVEHYADLWSRLASALAAHENILGWDLMNEPTHLPDGAEGWEAASQAALDAIRTTGDTRTVIAAGYSWATLDKFAYLHRDGPWLTDPLDNIRYAGHHYFDDRMTGRYLPYDIELGAARAPSGREHGG